MPLYPPSGGGNGSIKAWVTFSSVTPEILASYNISSYTVISAGTGIINFLTPMVDENYSVLVDGANTEGVQGPFAYINDPDVWQHDVNGFRISTANVPVGLDPWYAADNKNVSAVIFR